MPHSESFPARLTKYRKSNGWTQKQIAKKWDVSPETISAWERGRRRPDIILVPKLASELGMDRDELLEYIYGGTVCQDSFWAKIRQNSTVRETHSYLFRYTCAGV
jgi:transcriptional regulator with XRE-family HTH domain